MSMEKFIKFGLVGVLNTVITIIVFNLLRTIGVDMIVANIIGFISGMINSYFWNNRWVFKSNSKDINTICKFVVVNLIVMAINTMILILLAEKIGINEIMAQVMALTITTAINFIGNKFWTFNK